MRTNEEILRERAARIARETGAGTKVADQLHLVEFLLYPEKYAVETTFVREVIATKELTPLPGTPAYLIGILHLKGSVVSVIDLKTLLGLKEIGLTGTNKLILLKNDQVEFGILVDEVTGLSSVDEDQIAGPPLTLSSRAAEFIKGLTPSGTIVLDAARMLDSKWLIVN